MEEMNKDMNLNGETVETDNAQVNEEPKTIDNTDATSQENDTAEQENISAQTDQNYYTYEQGTPVTDNSADSGRTSAAVKDMAKSKATTALVLGIIAIVSSCLCCCCCLPIPVVLGIISLVMANKSKKLSADNKFSGMAIGAVICSILAIVGYVMYLVASSLYLLLFFSEIKLMVNEILAEYGYELVL